MEVSPLRLTAHVRHVPRPGLQRLRRQKLNSWRSWRPLAALAALPRVARRGREKVLDMAQMDGRMQEMQSTSDVTCEHITMVLYNII